MFLFVNQVLRPAGYYFASLALGLLQNLGCALWLGLGEVTLGFS